MTLYFRDLSRFNTMSFASALQDWSKADGNQASLMPTSITTAPGLIQEPFTKPGRPAQETRMSAREMCSSQLALIPKFLQRIHEATNRVTYNLTNSILQINWSPSPGPWGFGYGK